MSLTDSNKKKNYSNKTSNNTKVAKIDKKNLNIIRQIGNKAGSKNFRSPTELLNNKQKPAKVIQINIGLDKKNK